MNPTELDRIGRYQIRRFIAETSMSWVFEVTDTRFEGVEVVRALKLLKPDATRGPEFGQFRDESNDMAGFDHPNLVTIFDFARDPETDCFYYTRTWVDGTTLSQYVREQGPLSPARAVAVFSDVLSGLSKLHEHERQVVHRDIKPSNILIHPDGRAILADFGIARLSGERSSFDFDTNETPFYGSPEFARGETVAASSDIFSVGITLFYALVGRSRYANVDPETPLPDRLAQLAQSHEEIELDFGDSGVPEALADVVRKACRTSPDDRYANAREMREALRKAGGLRSGALQTTPEPPAAKSRSVPIAIGVGLALLLGAGLWAQSLFGARSDAAHQIERAQAELAAAPRVLESIHELGRDDLGPLLARVEQSVERARERLATSRARFDSFGWSDAEHIARDARLDLEPLCATLGDRVKADLDGAVAAANARVEALRRGGGEALGAPWEVFHARVEAMPGPPIPAVGCGALSARLDRSARARAVLDAAIPIHQTLEARALAAGTELPSAPTAPIEVSPELEEPSTPGVEDPVAALAPESDAAASHTDSAAQAKPVAWTGQTGVDKALRRYRDALNDRNIGELTQIWPRVSRSDDYSDLRALLARGGWVVDLANVSITRTGDEATATFEQSVIEPAAPAAVEKKKAWLRKHRSSELWYVEKMSTQ